VAAVVDRATHKLISVKELLASHPGASALVVNGSGSPSTMQVTTNEPGIAPSGGFGVQKFTDSGNHVHTIVLLYRSTGGPPAAVQHYVDGVLVSTSAYSWQKTSAGWVRTRSVFQGLRNGSLYGTYTTNTTPTQPGGGGGPGQQMLRIDHAPRSGPFERAAGVVLYGLALAVAPQSASAQMYFGPCLQEWLHYMGSAALLAGAAVTLADAPVLTPALIAQFVGMLATTAAFEDLLVSCMIAHDPAFNDGGSVFGGGGGGGGGAPAGKSECLNGGWAGCTISTVK
jgi:hypothetical protein